MEATKAASGTELDRGESLAVWRVPALMATLLSVGIVLLFFGTFQSIVSIWSRSDTFAHGFLILPISLYLIWEERGHLARLAPRPDYRALAALAFCGLGWVACRIAGILVLEQYFAVAMIPVAVWSVTGPSVMRRLAFPLGFLLLAVPVGEALIPPLIDFTAAFTVTGLRLSGVPVLQEGNFLTLANSQWSVVEACSGLRYLIACVTLGFLYAHLTYRSRWRKGLCILASIVVPIIANGFRAYMIVMMGYLSDMRIAVGVDHLIYGWIFFGVVVALFFWIGSFFREDHKEDASAPTVEAGAVPGAAKGFVVAGIAAFLVAAVWPVSASQSEGAAVELPADLASPLPAQTGEWTSSGAASMQSWQPHYVGHDFAFAQEYHRDGEPVGAHVACYAAQTQGAELVSSSNMLVGPDDHVWRRLEHSERTVSLVDRDLTVVESLLDARGPKLTVWSWYWIDGTSTASPYRAKLVEMTRKISGEPPLACGLTVFTREGDAAASRLNDFLSHALPEVENALVSLPRTGS